MVQSHSPTRVIIDTDLALSEKGKDVDDGLAVIMALNSPELDVIAISGVYGNTKLENVSKNVPRLLALFPEKENLPEYIEGAAGYEDWKLKSKLPGIARMAEVIKANAPVTVVPIGPLTNIALLLYFYPDVIDYIEELVVMGGSLNKWEFNFANDPPATDFVLKSALPTTICGYETCMAQKFTKAHYKLLKTKKTPRSDYLVKNIKGWLKLNSIVKKKGEERGFYPFDPTAIAYVIRPDLFESELLPVSHTNIDKGKHRKLDFSSITVMDEEMKAMKAELSEQELKTWVNWTLQIKSSKFMELLMERLV